VSGHQKRLIRAAGTVRESPGISRPELAGRLEINLSTASSLVAELIGAGLIRGAGRAASSGGRPAERLELSPDFACALGVEMSHRGVFGVLLDLGGAVIERVEGGRPRRQRTAPMLKLLRSVLRELAARAGGRPVAGAGIGVAGVMGGARGVSREFPNVSDWQDVDLGAALGDELGLEVEVDNDVRAATLAELRCGAGRGLGDFLYLHIGRGIALGSVVGGRLHRGASRLAGELGHFPLDREGPVCYCGSRGCLESIAAPPALLAEAREALSRGVKTSLAEAASDPQALTAAQLFAAAAEGDRLARNLVERAGEAIGRILAGLDNVLDPRAVVMGGLLAGGADALAEAIRSSHAESVMPLVTNTTEFRRAELGSDAPAVGAATLVFERLFEEPERLLKRLPAVGSRAR
jgi:predicted NBD/HSP70 family sugar kinase